jgi:hypothetical protein
MCIFTSLFHSTTPTRQELETMFGRLGIDFTKPGFYDTPEFQAVERAVVRNDAGRTAGEYNVNQAYFSEFEDGKSGTSSSFITSTLSMMS